MFAIPLDLRESFPSMKVVVYLLIASLDLLRAPTPYLVPGDLRGLQRAFIFVVYVLQASIM
jgi:hypothetical protein